MPITPPFYPIVYVRGYAATMDEIEDTVATPYMGFNLGSTKIRQDYEGRPVRFIFESPLIRLKKDFQYEDVYEEGDIIAEDKPARPESIWIFRYYEQVSKELDSGERVPITKFAEDLRAFILRIRKQVCGKDAADLKRFKVILAAHSMGGLVCRCYLQNICVKGTGDTKRDKQLELTGQVDSYVDKVFTYATPHNGIDMLGINVPGIKQLDPVHVRNFNRDAIRDYLNLPKKGKRGYSEQVNLLNGAFDPERFFCLVGTNYRDYTAFFGLSRRATGPFSDGLVMVRNASVEGAPRAYVHRSHSGHYGIVNSEEGYQNLRRFLFGALKVDVRLQIDELLLPKKVQELKDEGKTIRASYNIETTARVRGATYYLNERKVDQGSAILRKYDDLVKDKKPVYLFTGYLDPTAKTIEDEDEPLAFVVRVAVQVPMYEVNNKFWLDEHIEGSWSVDETILFHLYTNEAPMKLKYGLSSKGELDRAPRTAVFERRSTKRTRIRIPIGFKTDRKNKPRPGLRGRVLLDVTPWNA